MNLAAIPGQRAAVLFKGPWLLFDGSGANKSLSIIPHVLQTSPLSE